ncbi:MAG: inorganic pyrophosphatase [Ignavibacteria bacterium]|nr:inorganic pyrophosphatase [Ignavibacteria bacterium]
MMGLLFKPHPWHGIHIGKNSPQVVTSFVEIVPTDTIKYEIDKASGYLKVDRPQRYSNICPSLYGLIPQTYCAERVADLCEQETGRQGIVGDGDPLDICIITEKTISHGNIILEVIPIGGFRMIDGNEADDKIIAVLKGDNVYGNLTDIKQCPAAIIDRLKHYFLTYKELPGEYRKAKVEIDHVYGREAAFEVIKKSQEDYNAHFGAIEEMLTQQLRGTDGNFTAE